MSGIKIYGMLLLSLLGITSCFDDNNIGIIEGNQSVLQFDFPQGDNPWDREIEQIAKDWGMYIIYKGVDSVSLNKVWTNPLPSAPIYTCTEPTSDQVQRYLEVVSRYILGVIDKTNPNDLKKLPLYFYIVNDLKNVNPKSSDRGKYVRFYQGGLDYWALSMTSRAWEVDSTDEEFRLVVCAYFYQSIRNGFASGKYKVPEEFAAMTDYEYPISIRVCSYEEYLEDYRDILSWMPQDMWPAMYDALVPVFERNEEHLYSRNGFLPQLSENSLEVVADIYGAPFWMPWLEEEGIQHSLQPLEQRPLYDFLNVVCWAMKCTAEEILEQFPVDGVEDEVLAASNRKIRAKYECVVNYMKSKGIDLYIQL